MEAQTKNEANLAFQKQKHSEIKHTMSKCSQEIFLKDSFFENN